MRIAATVILTVAVSCIHRERFQRASPRESLMPSILVRTADDSSIEFELPEPGRGESCFFVGMHKAGSTLLANVARRLAGRAQLAFYSLPIDLWRKGVKFDSLTPDIQNVFMQRGYCYGGFKGLSDPIRLPAYASGRTVLLVRDPRDMLTSRYFSETISHPPPGSSLSDDRKQAFDAKRAQARDMLIDDYVLKRSSAVAKAYEATISKMNDIDYKLYRYEDIIHDKANWVADIAAYLDIKLGTGTIDRIIGHVDVVPQQENVVRHIRKVSPGNHREKLQETTIGRLNDRFAEIFEILGY